MSKIFIFLQQDNSGSERYSPARRICPLQGEVSHKIGKRPSSEAFHKARIRLAVMVSVAEMNPLLENGWPQHRLDTPGG
jgi:hypothetical protein